MAIYEFKCSKCGLKIERIVYGLIHKPNPFCLGCNTQMEQVEFSLPAKRAAYHGVQK